jgi:tripartite-type tricarboxylate transporter receptor subunit TctC
MQRTINRFSATVAPMFAAMLIALPLIAPSSAFAQADYPSRPIKIVVPFAPGTLPDTLSRMVGEKLAAKWGQPVVVENRPGATGNVGAEAVWKSPPDGYTLLSTPPPPLAINQSLFPKLGFDPSTFVPVTVIASAPNVLAVHPSVKAASVQELIALAKATPGKLNAASTGAGGTPHLTLEMFKRAAGVEIAHIPYPKGLAPALVDFVAGRVDMMFINLGNALPRVRNGQIKALAVASEKRVPELPDVPTLSEMFPGFVSTAWYAVVAPPNTPMPIAVKLSAAFAEALKSPDVASRLAAVAATPVGSSPGKTAAFLKAETKRWGDVIATAGIKLQ